MNRRILSTSALSNLSTRSRAFAIVTNHTVGHRAKAEYPPRPSACIVGGNNRIDHRFRLRTNRDPTRTRALTKHGGVIHNDTILNYQTGIPFSRPSEGTDCAALQCLFANSTEREPFHQSIGRSLHTNPTGLTFIIKDRHQWTIHTSDGYLDGGIGPTRIEISKSERPSPHFIESIIHPDGGR